MAKGDSALDSQLAEAFQPKEYQQLSEKFKAKVKASSQPGPFGLRTNPVWIRVFIATAWHALWVLGAVAGTQARWQSYACYVFLTLCSHLGVTAGSHRLWCHRSYKAKLPFRILLMCFYCISGQGTIYTWAKNHRTHHKYVDTDADPHTIKRGFFFAHIGWLLMHKLPLVLIKRKKIDMSDLKQDPVVMFQKKYFVWLWVLFSILIPTFLSWYFWSESLLVSFSFLFAFRNVTCLHCVFCVNSVAHLWGYRPYDESINPADNHLVACFTYGEGYHNYHHTFPFDYSGGEWSPKLNVTTCFIDLCAALGLVYDRKQVSQETILKMRQRKGNLDN